MSPQASVRADVRICGTCAFWGRDLMWFPGAPEDLPEGHGKWPGHCARKDARTGAVFSCALWSAP
jgi:hypothetical protein